MGGGWYSQFCYINKSLFGDFYVATLGIPAPPPNIDGVNEGITGVLLSDYWEIQLSKPVLEMTQKWQANKIGYQLGGGLVCSFEKYAGTKPISLL